MTDQINRGSLICRMGGVVFNKTISLVVNTRLEKAEISKEGDLMSQFYCFSFCPGAGYAFIILANVAGTAGGDTELGGAFEPAKYGE